MNTSLNMTIDKLTSHELLSKEEFVALLHGNSKELREELGACARACSRAQFGNKIYIRGLIEFTNYCKNNCYYCGIRCGNSKLTRYRLEKEEILACCEEGYRLGFRTFVLQGGEDPYYTDEKMIAIVAAIRERYPDCAITLSLGERSRESYEQLYAAGANRYLLRHETVSKELYEQLHPATMSLEHRLECLQNLKAIGYQTGCGFMVGAPGQTKEMLAEDLVFIQDFKPHMVGIGPYLSHKDTPFANQANGSMEDTLLLLSILRLMLPKVLLPSTTALGTISPEGRELGILAGANVVMPNLSPVANRKSYSLYDNKICTDEESAQSLHLLKEKMAKIGYEVVVDRGDFVGN